MGHTQCVSQTRESDTRTRSAEGRVETPDTRAVHKPAGVPVNTGRMILPNLIPEKSLIPIRLKDPGLEPRQRESTKDAFRGEGAMAQLAESGWYWGCITAAEAKQLLTEAMEGTFLLRDSSNPGYLLTLSVKTSLGPTHLRIAHSDGVFGFDSVVMARPRLRQFKGVVELVQHYAMAHRRPAGPQEQARAPEEEEAGGEEAPEAPTAPESTLQLRLTRPLYKSAPSLQHLCRIAINRHSRCHVDLPLPDRLKGYLLEYPFLL
ncbi:suppressor of cytokine signaling 2-like [Anguilla anguilla]|uniref:suppressor of cytokine signaling 2-like n=1 Tax=Anguilla anguilla TaxID=7936 RepID=UPI0015AE032B|nr:suppressor of cytokine signaling 2-like [Anguilla anguilla]XP_035239436.1 suppressor of cytokine signaling 2-like [Anguilla anguilla]XP_035239437.1 suppressor of cytokine signaling 2-like [Anguilla anguilla]XP_035239438.1 suppressor of cytokine signaling 2-like [Anguilla anguilla]XP_035239439.1 suppressor of cytokine signaling 2-like [Anguilla anguilla]